MGPLPPIEGDGWAESGVILDGDGQPILDDDGNPLLRVRFGEGQAYASLPTAYAPLHPCEPPALMNTPESYEWVCHECGREWHLRMWNGGRGIWQRK